jgi:hypothetical protein
MFLVVSLKYAPLSELEGGAGLMFCLVEQRNIAKKKKEVGDEVEVSSALYSTRQLIPSINSIHILSRILWPLRFLSTVRVGREEV